MEENKVTQPVVNPVPEVVGAAVAPKNNSNMIAMILVAIIALSIVIFGVFYYMNAQKNAPIQQATELLNKEFVDLEGQNGSMDLGNVDTEFTEIDKDLQSL